MSKLSDVKEATQQASFLSPDELIAVIEAEEQGGNGNGLCPFYKECYETLGLKTKHCSWNYDDPPTWRFCGGYKRRKKKL